MVPLVSVEDSEFERGWDRRGDLGVFGCGTQCFDEVVC